jgi:hypothetical protein
MHLDPAYFAKTQKYMLTYMFLLFIFGLVIYGIDFGIYGEVIYNET